MGEDDESKRVFVSFELIETPPPIEARCRTPPTLVFTYLLLRLTFVEKLGDNANRGPRFRARRERP